MSSFCSLCSIGSSMGKAQRCGSARAPIRRQRELVDDRSLEARESAFANALAVEVPKNVGVAADRGEPAQRRQQPVAVGRELVVIDDGDALAEALFDLQRLPNAREVRRARLLEARRRLAAGGLSR